MMNIKELNETACLDKIDKFVTFDDLFDKYMDTITDLEIIRYIKPLVEKRLTITDDLINISRKYIMDKFNKGNITEVNKKAALDILNLIEYVNTNEDWAFCPPLTFAQIGDFCKKYSDFYKIDRIKCYSDFTPAPLSLRHYMFDTNGGIYGKLVDVIKPGFELRLSEIRELYDPKCNKYYDKRIPDTSHILFALNLLIWRISKNDDNKDIIRDRIMITEWNRRVKEYYDKLQTVARNKHMHPSDADDEYFMLGQMLDDIMWEPGMNPYDDKVREANLSAYLHSICVIPDTLSKMAGNYFVTDVMKEIHESVNSIINNGDGLVNAGDNSLTENVKDDDSLKDCWSVPSGVPIITQAKKVQSLNESNSLEGYQQELIDKLDGADLEGIYGSVSEQNSDVNALFFMNSLIEATYLYGNKSENRSKMINLRTKILNSLSESVSCFNMDDFKESPYYNKYTELECNIKHIRAINNYLLNK